MRSTMTGYMLVAGALAALTACGGSDSNSGSGGSAGSAGGAAGSAGSAGGAGMAGAAGATSTTQTLATAKGSFTIETVDSTNNTTCSVTIEVDGVEDNSTPWQAPGAEKVFRSARNITANTCGATGISETELFAWSQGKFFGAKGFLRALEFGTATVQGNSVTLGGGSTIDIPPNGTLTVTLSGSLTLGTTEDDPLHGWRPSGTYSCGWPMTHPPASTAGYRPSVGDMLPDGVFTDQCGDKVRLLDLTGRYLVIQANQWISPGCPPCDQGAMEQKQFEDDMQAAGIETLVVSMLVPDYNTPWLSPAVDDLKTFVTRTGTSGVVLADRGFAMAALTNPGNLPPATASYPGYLVVAPDGKIISGVVGYGTSVTWADVENQIKTDAGK